MYIDTIPNSYAASSPATALAASATDVLTITASSTKTVYITGFQLSGVATSATAADVRIIKRSTADTGGTSGAITAVPLSSKSSAATASVLAYSANPAVLGTAVGTVTCPRISMLTSTTATAQPVYINLSVPIILVAGSTENVAINLNGVTIAGGSLHIDVFWTEQ